MFDFIIFVVWLCQRLSSTTTRIKTWQRWSDSLRYHCVRDYLPLQQGLRRSGQEWQAISGLSVRDYLPLQQGLRLYEVGVCAKVDDVRDYLPLQQGLRLLLPLLTGVLRLCQRLSSTTTRIKTFADGLRHLSGSQRLSSTTTRIKTRSQVFAPP